MQPLKMQVPLCLMTAERSVRADGLPPEKEFSPVFCVSQLFYSPMDCIMPFRAVFMGSFSGSLAEGSPSQSQR